MSRSSRWRITVAAAAAIVGLAVAPAVSSLATSPKAPFMGTRQYYAAHPDNNPIPGPLLYSGGPVMRTSSVAYTIFWQPSGTYMSPTYKTLINRYFTDINGSSFYGLLTQYYSTAGNIQNNSTLGGTWTDTSSYPSSTLSDANVEAEIGKAMTTNGWSGGINHIFYVYYSRNEQACSNHVGGCAFSYWCAFHWNARINGQNVLYANMPYIYTNPSACGNQAPIGHLLPGPNGNPDADSEISATSHEHFESVTDPIDHNPSYQGWRDASGYEIGDKCAYYYGSVASDGGNLTMNGNRYLVQQEWSNRANYCALS